MKDNTTINILLTVFITAFIILLGVTNNTWHKEILAAIQSTKEVELSAKAKVRLQWMKELVNMTIKKAAAEDGNPDILSVEEQKKLVEALDFGRHGFIGNNYMILKTIDTFPLIMGAKATSGDLNIAYIYFIDSTGKEHSGAWTSNLLEYCGYEQLGEWGMSVANYAAFE